MWNLLILWQWHDWVGGDWQYMWTLLYWLQFWDIQLHKFPYKSVTANQGICRYKLSQKISVCMALRIHTVVFWVTPPHNLLAAYKTFVDTYYSISELTIHWMLKQYGPVTCYQPSWRQCKLQHKLRIVPHNLQHSFQVGYMTHSHSKDSWRDLPPLSYCVSQLLFTNTDKVSMHHDWLFLFWTLI